MRGKSWTFCPCLSPPQVPAEIRDQHTYQQGDWGAASLRGPQASHPPRAPSPVMMAQVWPPAQAAFPQGGR